MTVKLGPIRCDKFKSGICAAEAALGHVVYCLRARAEFAGPGQCCHHPLRRVRERLETLKSAGVRLARYGKRLRDEAFVDRLYRAFLRARSKRSGL